MSAELSTDRLVIRGWRIDDAEPAQALYGNQDVIHWLTPEMQRVDDVATMRDILGDWVREQPHLLPPRGRWAIQRAQDGAVIGGISIRLLPPYDEDLEVSWQVHPDYWGNGYAPEAGRAIADWAFTQDIDELFAVARPDNTRAIAAAKRIGMEWVGETTKYYEMPLQVYRVRPNEFAA